MRWLLRQGPPKPRISVVVVSYNMHRELPRTLATLVPPYQQGIGAREVEVIVVDNGSRPAPSPDSLPAGGRLIHVDAATPSPVRAINIGLREARADVVGVMIDGARMASPGLLHYVLLASTLHERPVVSTLGFHLGPEVQMTSVEKGYCQSEEDRLLASVDWRDNGYRLFDISVFAGSSEGGWFLPMAESNALFMTSALWTEIGGYDERFATPGGGLVNLDTYSRVCELPETTLITLLGEGTFHQVHGGVATNQKRPDANWAVFHDEYVRIRGRDYRRPTRTAVYLGTMPVQVAASVRLSAEHLSR